MITVFFDKVENHRSFRSEIVSLMIPVESQTLVRKSALVKSYKVPDRFSVLSVLRNKFRIVSAWPTLLELFGFKKYRIKPDKHPFSINAPTSFPEIILY